MKKKREKQPPPKNADIAARIEKFLESIGKNQEWLAVEVEISATAVSNWFSKGTIALENIIKLAQKHNLSLDWVLLGRGEMRYGAAMSAQATPPEPLPPHVQTIMEIMEPLGKKAIARIMKAVWDEAGREDQPAADTTPPESASSSGPRRTPANLPSQTPTEGQWVDPTSGKGRDATSAVNKMGPKS